MLQAMQRQAQAQAQAQQPVGPKEWAGLKDMPAKTQASLNEVLSRMTSKGQTEMTVVFVGKQGAGKSSTLNSVLNERVAAAAPFQPETLRPLLAARRAAASPSPSWTPPVSSRAMPCPSAACPASSSP